MVAMNLMTSTGDIDRCEIDVAMDHKEKSINRWLHFNTYREPLTTCQAARSDGECIDPDRWEWVKLDGKQPELALFIESSTSKEGAVKYLEMAREVSKR